ncbi:MAG: hypothetical protein ACRD41_15185 [Candidatus Acidiferrales bacterium]
MLEGKLAGYRILYREQVEQGEKIFRCDFAEHRSIVYQLFQKLLLEELSEQ